MAIRIVKVTPEFARKLLIERLRVEIHGFLQASSQRRIVKMVEERYPDLTKVNYKIKGDNIDNLLVEVDENSKPSPLSQINGALEEKGVMSKVFHERKNQLIKECEYLGVNYESMLTM